MDILKNVYQYIVGYEDPRIKNWIIFSPYTVVVILFCYFYFVFVCGPRFMKNRNPYSLKTFIKCYDIFQIMMNGFIVYKLIKGGWFTSLSIYCEPITYSTDPVKLELLNACWWTVLLKLIDLIETGIYVLRKKKRQISFLHLYHHVSTMFITWVFAKYYSDGMGTFFPLVNCSVHVIMYTYYFFSTFGPNIQKILYRYKYLLTIIQMIQFVILICHAMQMLSPNCNYSKIPGAFIICNYCINFILFYNFYKKNYLTGKGKQN
ncbi:elongation of very long chain fatty acids protein AAEL008004-like [Vespa mandarinia]|uniref:elongation of very long chain fatty acids protein AAEL008004-like n=1 Tax=Vespa mandarinia TaxID=7446 RepID=UPI00160AC162|nr:elongation of very long chain fatty acids protein AAEL008004-like [Vespa mandarinia]